MTFLSFESQTRGTPAMGGKRTHSHIMSRFSGRSNFHKQKRRDAQQGGGSGGRNGKIRRYSWSVKAIRRNRTGTGRMRTLKHVHRLEKNGYRSGCQATKKVQAN